MKKFLLSCFLLVFGWTILAQTEIRKTVLLDTISDSNSQLSRTFLPTGGLVSYYFWEEDTLGFILKNEIQKPFLQNYSITCSPSILKKDSVSYSDLLSIIKVYANDETKNNNKNYFEIKYKNQSKNFHFPLKREATSKRESVIQINTNGVWTSKKRKSVIYISVSSDNKWKFYKTSDSIQLSKDNVNILSNGQYIVYTYLKEDSKKIIKEEVFTYSGENVTNYFLTVKSMDPKRVIVFANGYRGYQRERDESDNLVLNKDKFYYWFKIDNQFIDRIKPDASYFIDGNFSIKTSNHRSNSNFLICYVRSTILFRKSWNKKQIGEAEKVQNLNVEGFSFRKEQGKIAGKAFLDALCNSPACQQTKDTVDVVCHSMGYAYSLGFIEEIKSKVVFGKFYILAPENASADSTDWKLFEEVWQYGSNEKDPIWEQDGIAKQVAVKGIETISPDKGGRIYFPVDWPKRNFIDSHMLYNFDWIFDCISKGEKGYIY